MFTSLSTETSLLLLAQGAPSWSSYSVSKLLDSLILLQSDVSETALSNTGKLNLLERTRPDALGNHGVGPRLSSNLVFGKLMSNLGSGIASISFNYESNHWFTPLCHLAFMPINPRLKLHDNFHIHVVVCCSTVTVYCIHAYNNPWLGHE